MKMPIFSKKFRDTFSDIKSVRIQGAEHIAWKGSVAAADEILREINVLSDKTYSKRSYLEIANRVKHKMLSSRPTEPALNNAMAIVVGRAAPKSRNEALKRLEKARARIQSHFKGVYMKVSSSASQELSKYSSCYTHCHSSLAVQAITASKMKVVYNTETRPLYQGRKTARELSKKGVLVHHYVDSAMRSAISKSECVIIGADSITMRGDVMNKIGSGMVAMIAASMEKPLYVIADSYKIDIHSIEHDTVIEERSGKEVWSSPPSRVLVHNPAFEKIKASQIAKIICEQGAFIPKKFVQNAIKAVKSEEL